MSDVPIGLFLSGGIDSSAVGIMLRDAPGSSAVSSFSMGFDDGSYNELPYAREVAALCGTAHHEGTVTPDVAALFDRLVVHLDEPFADVSLFPTFLVSQMAREHVKVVLTGDGGDELFGGYDAYQAEALAGKWAGLMPEAATRAADAVLALVPPTDKKKGLVNKARRFVDGLAHAPASIAQYRWMTFLGADAKERLYTPAFRDALVSRRRLSAGPRGAGPGGRRRPAEPPALRRPVDLSRRRHPREGRSDEHGDVARDARAVSRRRRHGAGVLDARRFEDSRRHAQVHPQAGAARLLPDASSTGRRKASASR